MFSEQVFKSGYGKRRLFGSPPVFFLYTQVYLLSVDHVTSGRVNTNSNLLPLDFHHSDLYIVTYGYAFSRLPCQY